MPEDILGDIEETLALPEMPASIKKLLPLLPPYPPAPGIFKEAIDKSPIGATLKGMKMPGMPKVPGKLEEIPEEELELPEEELEEVPETEELEEIPEEELEELPEEELEELPVETEKERKREGGLLI